MRTIEIKAYKFSELSEDAKQTAIENYRDINTSFDWWEFTCEDASNIGLKIYSFDFDHYVEGKFIYTAEECAVAITENHGESCETFKTAQTFLKDLAELRATITEDDDKEDEEDELNTEFLKSLCEDYRIMLRNEYEYQQSDESVIETIEANGYEFTEGGEEL